MFVGMIFCGACTRVYRVPPPAFKMNPDFLKMKAYTYEHYQVKVDGTLIEIDKKSYDAKAATAYYDSSGAKDALQWSQLAIKDHRLGNGAVPLWFGMGLSFAVIPGYLVAMDVRKRDSAGYITGFAYVLCLASGTILGTAGGLAVKHAVYRPRSNEKNVKAGNSFNQYLRQELQLKLNPAPEGFKAGASTRF